MEDIKLCPKCKDVLKKLPRTLRDATLYQCNTCTKTFNYNMSKGLFDES